MALGESTPSSDLRWWLQSDTNLADSVVAAAQRVEQQQGYRKGMIIHALKLYGTRSQARTGTNWSDIERSQNLVTFRDELKRRLSLNVVRNMVDAATSRLTRGRPRPQNVTSDGDYTLQKQARQRDKLVDGLFYQGNFWGLRDRVVKSCALLGTGVIHTFSRWGQVQYEYVFPGEVFVDDGEALLQYPRSLYRIRPFDKTVLKALFPKATADIESTATIKGNGDQAIVYEAWHLPSGPDAKDGLYVCAIQGKVLNQAKWERDKFPFSFWKWSEEPLGFWGTGLAEQLSGIQLEINQLLRVIQENIYRGGNIKIFLEHGSNVIESSINNSIRGTLIYYTGTPPDFHVHDVFSQQISSHLQYLVSSAYEITGISQLSAQGQIPSGLSGSGRSQLVYRNIESERFVTVQRCDEQAVKDVAEQSIYTAQDVLKGDSKYKVVYRSKSWLEELDVKEALEETGPFELQILPASQLPHDYAGRVAFAEYLESKGWIDQDTAKDLADIPDVDAAMQTELAPKRLIDSEIEAILEKGEWAQPTPRMNLQLAIDRGSKAWQHARLRKYPLDRLDMLNTWIEGCVDLMAKASAPLPPPTEEPIEPTQGPTLQ